FLAEDFQSLDATEQAVLMRIAERQPIAIEALSGSCAVSVPTLKGLLSHLTNLGFLRRAEAGFLCANHFFRAWLTRAGQPDPSGAGHRFRFDDVAVDLKRREVSKNGQTLSLTRKEFAILRKLLECPGEVVDR